MNESNIPPQEEKNPQSEKFDGGPAETPPPLITRLVTTGVKILGAASVLLKRLFSAGDGNDDSAFKDIRQAFANWNLRKTAFWTVLLLVLGYGFSGIYVVNPGEQAVVKLFGKAIGKKISEGLHYRLPWPMHTVDVVNVSTIRREEMGMLLPEHASIHPAPGAVQFLSGDNNIIDIQGVIQYPDDSTLLFRTLFRDPGRTLYVVCKNSK